MKSKSLVSITVIPKDFSGLNMSITQLFGIGPKWTITCGHCESTFKKRIPLLDKPGIVCPYCNTTNIIPIVWSEND